MMRAQALKTSFLHFNCMIINSNSEYATARHTTEIFLASSTLRNYSAEWECGENKFINTHEREHLDIMKFLHENSLIYALLGENCHKIPINVSGDFGINFAAEGSLFVSKFSLLLCARSSLTQFFYFRPYCSRHW